MAKTGYIGINNVAHKIKNIYVGVNGVARKVKSAYIGDENGIARQWYTSGIPIRQLDVGTIVKIKVDNVLTDFIVVNQGKPNDAIYDDSFNNGTWLLMKDCSFEHVFGNDNNNYANGIGSYLNSNEFLSHFEDKITNIMMNVNIPYKSNLSSHTILSKVFIISMGELGYSWWRDSSTNSIYGTSLDYFKGIQDDGYYEDTSGKRISNLLGTETSASYWTRSANMNFSNSNRTTYVFACNGTTCGNASYSDKRNIRPTFIVPQDTLINPETMEIIV